MAPHANPAFVSLSSSFSQTRPALRPKSAQTAPFNVAAPMMAVPRHARRDAEIKRVMQQLEELKAQRESLSRQQQSPSPSAPAASPAPAASSAPAQSAPAAAAGTPPLSFGRHSFGGRFLTVSSVDSEETYPVLLPVAGALPSLTPAAIRSVPRVSFNKPVAPGSLFLVTDVPRAPPDAPPLQFLAVPAVEALLNCKDPVVVFAPPAIVSAVKMPAADDDLVALIVDVSPGAVAEFDSKTFYLWDAQGEAHVGWLEQVPPPDVATRFGRVVYGVIEVDIALRKKKSCWEEENETYT